ncbi:MAG TPA: zf-HC2 domain-containing protein [Actinomycetales bacterium]
MSDDPHELSAGAYVLGALDPAESAAFAEHLRGCPACAAQVTELATLPGLLARVPVAQVEAVDDPPPLPASLLPGLLAAVRTHRRRRTATRVLAVAAASAVVGAGIGSAAVRSQDPAPPSQAMQSLVQAPLEATVDIASVAWGSRVRLQCKYSGADGVSRPYALVVIGDDGRRESIGTWTAVPGDQVQLSGATSLARADIAAVEVQSLTGVALLRLSGHDAAR